MSKSDEVLWLRFLPREPDAAASSGDSYQLTPDKLELPIDFHGEFNSVLVAVALASIKPATEQVGRYVADLLLEPTEKTRRLLDAPPQSLSAATLATLQFSYAMAAVQLGEQMGENIWLTRACDAFKAVLNVWTREHVPLQWAGTQNNLGNALQTLGERGSGAARLEQAVAAYREALKEYTRERVPLDWAMTQNNLGTALQALGERESGTARLEQAVDAFRRALGVFRTAGASHYVSVAAGNLARAEALLAERRQEAAGTAPT